VTATLSGPNGATVPLETGAAEPVGVHSFVWDGTFASVPQPEGAWTFTVTATDDRHVTTTATRTFSLDNTLGALTVSSGRVPTAHFVLSRQADVVVRVERRNGIAVAAVHLPHLPAGGHRMQWRGKKAGRYLMRVDATSIIGTSSLVAPFTLK
jgi:flagellar hook assembly protein FlgD